MFDGCSSLTSLNLSNFDTSKLSEKKVLFKDCKKLEYINFKKFNEINIISYTNIFKAVPENAILCINEELKIDKLLTQITQKKCFVIDCSDDWRSKQKKVFPSINGCEC